MVHDWPTEDDPLAVIDALTSAVPSFKTDWRADRCYWTEDGTLIGHSVIGDLCREVLGLTLHRDDSALENLGAVVERCLVEGGQWGAEYAETGLLETLGNLIAWEPVEQRATAIERFARCLGPVGRERWGIHTSDIPR
ncbi:MAG: hypothetical protein QOI95_3181 [Acidimicrobiaceae bacterium]|jgi:hypothetical protein